jgi:hypothetical protein
VQYVTQFSDPSADATFGQALRLRRAAFQELSLTRRVDWAFSPVLSLQLFAQPLVAAGEYLDIKSLAEPRTTISRC